MLSLSQLHGACHSACSSSLLQLLILLLLLLLRHPCLHLLHDTCHLHQPGLLLWIQVLHLLLHPLLLMHQDIEHCCLLLLLQLVQGLWLVLIITVLWLVPPCSAAYRQGRWSSAATR